MGLEIGSYIANLQSSNPASGDPVNQGDDHIRLLKAVLKTQFPGAGGTGFSEPILATEAELNYLQGLTSNVQDQINTATSAIPSGSRLIFLNPAPPTGWNLITTWSSHMLRVVSGVGGGSGGSHNPILNDFIPVHSHSASGTVNINSTNIAHTHGFTTDSGGAHTHLFDKAQSSSTREVGVYPALTDNTTGSTQSGGTHTHTGTTNSGGGSHNHTGSISVSVSNNSGAKAGSWQPQYVDGIPCEKV